MRDKNSQLNLARSHAEMEGPEFESKTKENQDEENRELHIIKKAFSIR